MKADIGSADVSSVVMNKVVMSSTAAMATTDWLAHVADREALTRQDVVEVAELALLNVADEDLDRYTEQLEAVFDLAGKLNEFDVSDVPPTSHPFGLVNVFRPDGEAGSAVSSDDSVRAEALAGGPEVEDNQFKVPPALGESP